MMMILGVSIARMNKPEDWFNEDAYLVDLEESEE